MSSAATRIGAESGGRGQLNIADLSVPDLLQKGTPMTKISEKKKKKLSVLLDADQGQIVYESSKSGIIPIETIKEIRSGADARYYRVQFAMDEACEDRWLTLIYIIDGKYKTLHLLADTRDVFKLWDTTLRKLHSIRVGLMGGMGNTQMRDTVWEKQFWKGADVTGDKALDFEEIRSMCVRLNVNASVQELQTWFKLADTKASGRLDYESFQRFTKLLKRRPDIDIVYERMKAASGDKVDFAAFEKFMKEWQKSRLSSEDLQKIFRDFSTDGIMSEDDLKNLLFSEHNSPFSERGFPIHQDMTQPLSEYYMSSSHNTYLVGHQLVGVSTIEGYIRALLHGCRTVELDIYDDDDGPTVYHGKTLTSKVPVKDICEAINKYAFMSSPYPVVISAEVHCSVAQQDMIVEIMNKTFGDKLIKAPVEGRPKVTVLPSPEDLKGKILLKAKNLYIAAQLEAIQAQRSVDEAKALTSSSTSSSDSEPGMRGEINQLKTKWRKMRGKGEKKPKPKMSMHLASLLVYTVGVRCHGIDHMEDYSPEHIFSLSENKAKRLMDADMARLVKYTQNHVVRIYPKGTRVDSTNYEPHLYWAAGAQVVAINWQTFDLGYIINQAMFLRNGGAGFVLKPPALRPGGEELLGKRTKHYFDITVISAQQLPRPRDENGHEIIESSAADPFVEVSLHIPDWSHAPFLPAKDEAQTAYSPSTEATKTDPASARTVSLRTKVIKNNGFNPMWQEELCLPFDCVGDMKELIFVEFAVRQKGKDDEDDKPLAMYCVPLGCLEQGFRHLPLHDEQMSQYLFSTLFVQIGIRDA
ncbi:PLC-like phosphodiesterase [Schizophyllum amplum]|uniref:Phosphoinositide phospholipase C n=1 Tax=Schizophyllum amplum TaxID=97359 RepID=A0A550CQQ2_9AGAR|nr:PLC-like phosphodiesterase [Auriculariopsis ampla]